MRNLAVQYGTIQITSVTGESRYASVTGAEKFRVLWLLRNFSILDFPVLSKKEQRLITRLWHTGTSGTASMTVDVLGSIEGFPKQLSQPQLCPTQVPGLLTQSEGLHLQLRVAQSREASAAVVELSQPPMRAAMPSGLRSRAVWAAIGLSLMGCAIHLWPIHLPTPHPHVPVGAARSVSLSETSSARDAVFQPMSSAARSSTVAGEASNPIPTRLPYAMATPSPDTTAPQARKKKPEVMIRVSVDGEGHAESWKVLQGDKTKALAALAAAKNWRFQPCVSSESCEHLLKFTDRGDVSVLQMVD